MKAFVIVFISLYIVTCVGNTIIGIRNENPEAIGMYFILSILAILALIFTCVGW
jgi:membrane protein CcdC involved in cytochrome C biogenesis